MFSKVCNLNNRIPQFKLEFVIVLGHLSHSGDLLLGWRPSCVERRVLTSFPQELLGQSFKTKFGMQHLYCKRQDIENFMTFTPIGGNFRVKNVKLMYFFKNDPRSRSSCARARPYTSYSENALFALILYKPNSLPLGIDQINQVCMMMTKEGSTEIVNF